MGAPLPACSGCSGGAAPTLQDLAPSVTWLNAGPNCMLAVQARLRRRQGGWLLVSDGEALPACPRRAPWCMFRAAGRPPTPCTLHPFSFLPQTQPAGRHHCRVRRAQHEPHRRGELRMACVCAALCAAAGPPAAAAGPRASAPAAGPPRLPPVLWPPWPPPAVRRASLRCAPLPACPLQVCMDMPDDCTARLVDAAGQEVDATNTGGLPRPLLPFLAWPAGRESFSRQQARHPLVRSLAPSRRHPLCVARRCALQTARRRRRWRS